MILWKKDSDLYFTFQFKDNGGVVTDPLIKSFIIKIYTTNKLDYREASYNKETGEFINCEVNENDPTKIDIFINKPNFNVGRVLMDLCFKTPNDNYEDGYYDFWVNIKTDIQIVN